MMNKHQANLASQLLATIEAAGLTLEDLAGQVSAPLPLAGQTVFEFHPIVEMATTEGARKTYAPYWRQLVAAFGERRLSDIQPSELRVLALQAQANAVKRANGRNGLSARENCVAAMRAFFRLAVEDGIIEENPAEKVPKPRRQASQRRQFTDAEVARLYTVTSNGGDDPVLDTLLLRFHLETGARRGGALSLRRRDLDVLRQLIRLREKNDTERWQPVSRTLVDALVEHCDARGASGPDDAVFRRLPRGGESIGPAVTRRRYNTLTARWGRSIPWVKELGVSIHWCRHHATSAIERIAGYGVARAFAGHATSDEVTTTYIKAQIHEVARAVAIYTGEPHPLAD